MRWLPKKHRIFCRQQLPPEEDLIFSEQDLQEWATKFRGGVIISDEMLKACKVLGGRGQKC